MDDYFVDEGPDAPWRTEPRVAPPMSYRELPPEQRGEVEEELFGGGYLACEINHGRRLIVLPVEDAGLPYLKPLERPGHEALEDFINLFSDATASILAAAEWEGIDPAWLCQRAMRTNTILHREG